MCIASFVPFSLMWTEKVSCFVIGNKITVLRHIQYILISSQCYNIFLRLSFYLFGGAGFGSIRFRFAYFRLSSYRFLLLLFLILFVHFVQCCCFWWFKNERSFEIINYRFCSSINNVPQFTIMMYTIYTHIPSHYTFYLQHLIMFITFWFSINSSTRYTTIDSAYLWVYTYLPWFFLNCFVVRSIILLLCLIAYALEFPCYMSI